ncbi:MAG: CopD family protein [Alphaproteobacteria bacterium]|nr:CopD family protein [Alphaproteobacteria bacterium]
MTILATGLHVLAAVIWIGGMFFAYMVLRPAVAGIEAPPERLRLWGRVLERFFRWVWGAVVVLPASGYWLVFDEFGGLGAVGIDTHIMQGVGLLMILIFLHLYFAPYRRFGRALAAEDLAAAAAALGRIRTVVAINLALGLALAAIGATGAYWG